MPSREAAHWALDPAVAFLNHGSFGACPRPVLEAQRAWQDRMEAQPVQFFARDLPGALAEARAAVGRFVGADPDDLGFVANATGAVNAVLRSLDLERGDELLTNDHEYNATLNVLRHVADRAGAQVVVVPIPAAPASVDVIVDAHLAAVTPRTRVALVSHVTSPTAIVFPIERLVRELDARGVETLVDGAHAPGMVPLDLERIGAAWYTGNLHKWVCAPKGAAFLHARRDRQARLRPGTISHGANAELADAAGSTGSARSRFRAEFDWQGTLDPSAWLAVPDAITFMAGLDPGGWPAIQARNHEATLRARDAVADVLGVPEAERPADELLGAMIALRLPAEGPLATAGAGSSPLDTDPVQRQLLDDHGIEVPIYPWPVPAARSPTPARRFIRISSQIHNGPDDVARLMAALRTIAADRAR